MATKFHCRRALWLRLWLVSGLAAGATEIDESLLPPPAQQKIDFVRDIKPIFQDTCWRCHGPERPKSHFRLTDRALALKGGDDGVDIIPGNSAKSPLIHYVSRLVPDMEMPPEGKAPPLTTNQVGLLRAWIDQGLVWNDTSATQAVANASVSVAAGGTTVHGDKAKFRELEWKPHGWDGGLESFDVGQRWADGSSVTAGGHASRDDYKVSLDLRKPDLGFAQFRFEEFRKYFDDAGGYYGAFSPSLYRLPEEPHLDIGRAGVDFGLTLPNLPRIVLGYEYQFKDGTKSMLSWGPVGSPTGSFADLRSIYPSVKDIDEHTHVFKVDLSYDLKGFELQDNFRAELYDSATRRTDALGVPASAAAPSAIMLVDERHRYTQIANSATVQKEVFDWWLAGAGYRYSWLDGDAALRLSAQDANGRPAAGSAWSGDKILLHETWQMANANSQFRILPSLTATVGAQGEWKRQDTFGDVNLDEVVDPTDPTSGVFRSPATDRSSLDQTTAEENVLLRYTGLPFTSWFAEAKLKQEQYDKTAEQSAGAYAFKLASDARVRWQDYRIGFSSSPAQIISFGGHYRHRDRQTDYDYDVHQSLIAYPGFITARNILSDEVEARMAIRPANWLRATLTYQWSDSDFHTTTLATSSVVAGPDATPGGKVLAGRYEANTFSGNLTLTPFRRLYFGGTASYQKSRTISADNDSTSVAPYEGDMWNLMSSVTFILDDATDLFAAYSFTRARYGQHNAATGLPLGIDYDRHGIQGGVSRRFGKVVTTRLQYGYFSYREPSSNHLNDFRAHQVMAVVNMRW